MSKQKESILAWVMAIGFLSHYIFGYFFWDEIKVANIYYISVYFNMDILGFVVYLLAHSRILKGMGALGMILGTYYFYMEFNDPASWILRDYLTLGLLFANCFFLWLFTDKIKNKKL